MNFRTITRQFLLESVEEDITKLRVLDFDDTLAHTVEKVRVETPTGPKHISSDEYASYTLGPGEYFDKDDIAFKEFSKIDIDSATPVPLVSDLFKRFVDAKGSRKVLILTARDQIVKPWVMKFLEERLGIENPEDKVDFVGVGSPLPGEKVKIIAKYINENPTITTVSFYDDSHKNTRAVKEYILYLNSEREKESLPDIYSDIATVVHNDDGTVELERLKQESIGPRTLTRDFLIKFN